ncbi:DUF885 domain-containing protein [Lysobacter psychrotolerans]|uniref:DUF885 domain-containing protein n=1 Tax=Montanilutibacter psychrotolerans TaxID=1327343 RepID=A0A3M8ST23_9GAMM|nr:DUF885 domain-containing protein [Lysobacter psychrotolerans]RNF82636.1 DUF885 domain-containing protein [Lysobacter psychrotolerans]
MSLRATPLAAALLTITLAACQPQATPAPTGNQPAATSAASSQTDARFADLSQRWLDGWLQLQPVTSTQTGDHRNDTALDDFSAAGRQKMIDFSRKILAELDTLDVSSLSRENQVDAAILRNQVRYDIWTVETLQSWAWDPQLYTGTAGSAIYTLMARDFAPMPQRLKSVTQRMEKLPTLFAQMRENLDPNRVPKIHAETVAKQNSGLLSLIDELVAPNAKSLSGAERKRLDAAIATLRTAVADQQKWLDETLVPNAKGNFRLGQTLYDEKLAFALNSPLTRTEIRTRAEAAIGETRREMYEIARKLLSERPNAPNPMPLQPNDAQQQAVIEAALELAYADRPARDKVVELAKQSTTEATAFVREKNLVSVPDTPVQVILMPEFQRGVAVAYCDSPGALDKGLDTFYAVSPIPDAWTPEQVDSFLREYNTRSIHELSIHEAMPGHYLQIAHSNKHPSTLRAVLGSGSFIEGWAMYAEKVLADAGYMNNDPLMQLIQRKWALRAMANAILDQAIHVDGMSQDDAMKLMTQTTFQQEREAAGKWVRAQLTSAQLPTYFVGYSEHLDLRREVEKRDGKAFDIKAYHDKVLSYGSPPVRFARELMLDQPIK